MNDEEGILSINPKEASYREVVHEHLRRVIKLSSCELRGGFWTRMTTKDGGEKLIYVQDTRETLCNAILCLAFLLQPKFDKKQKDYFKIFNEELDKKKMKFLDKTKINDKQILGEDYYDKDEKKLLIEYKIEKLELHLELFAELCILLSSNPLGIGEATYVD